jgi:hypothetical protein
VGSGGGEEGEEEGGEKEEGRLRADKKYCAAANEPASESSESIQFAIVNAYKNDSQSGIIPTENNQHFTERDIPITAATEPVLGGRENIENESSIITREKIHVREIPTGKTSGFITSSSIRSTGPTACGSGPGQPRTWTALFTQSLSILSGGGDGTVSSTGDLDVDNPNPNGHFSTDPGISDDLNPRGHDEHFIARFLRKTMITTHTDNSGDLLNIDQSFESCQTPSLSPRSGLDDNNVSEDVFVTHPPSPGPAQTSMSPGSVIPSTLDTIAETSRHAKALRTKRPCLSDVFVPQVPDIPAPNVDPGPVPMPSATLGPALAGPPVTLGVDFIQMNCGKRISAMTQLETNAKNRIALIQEPYTSISGCTLLHKRDFYCWSTTPPCTVPSDTVPVPSAAWTS